MKEFTTLVYSKFLFLMAGVFVHGEPRFYTVWHFVGFLYLNEFVFFKSSNYYVSVLSRAASLLYFLTLNHIVKIFKELWGY